jgi:hypothetical protein
MKSALLVFMGMCTVGAATDYLRAQTILGDTETRVTGGKPPVPDATFPTVTRKLIQINGTECE